jgi:hypothetical protein
MPAQPIKDGDLVLDEKTPAAIGRCLCIVKVRSSLIAKFPLLSC